MKRGKRKEKGKIKDEMLKHFFEQEISMGSEWQKRLLQMCREGALPTSISQFLHGNRVCQQTKGQIMTNFTLNRLTDITMVLMYQRIVRMEYFRKMNFLVRNC